VNACLCVGVFFLKPTLPFKSLWSVRILYVFNRRLVLTKATFILSKYCNIVKYLLLKIFAETMMHLFQNLINLYETEIYISSKVLISFEKKKNYLHFELLYIVYILMSCCLIVQTTCIRLFTSLGSLNNVLK